MSAGRSQGSFSPQSAATSILFPDASASSPTAVAELLAESPGVSQNGQGGLFQTYSVRGVSGQRILTLVEGVRIVSERRAGVSASFIDPLLLGSVEVVRGPSSTYWGSGALGGVVQLFPRRFEDASVVSGYSSEGNQRFARVGYGVESGPGSWSWGVAAREAGLSRTPGGEALLSGFEQVSAIFRRSWSSDRMAYETLVLASKASDIGKPSTDFPERIASYPSETHGLFRFSADHDNGWRFEAYAHPNELETRVEALGREVSEVSNRAFDWGIDLQRELRLSSRRTLRWGVDVFARRDVRSREVVRDSNDRVLLEQETLANASEQELGVYGAIETSIGSRGSRGTILFAGGRLALQNQRNADSRKAADSQRAENSALTGFVGIIVPLPKGFELTSNLGTGLRFPSISERFFTGTSGRGTVVGNSGLTAESSISADVGLKWTGASVFVGASLFRNEIEDYIERVETVPNRLTFVNLVSGRIEGVEVEGAWQASTAWSLSFGGHAMAGEDDGGRPLADIPAERVFAAWRFERIPWTWRGRWEKRFEKTDLGSGEKAIPGSDLVSASLSWRWRSDLGIRLSARNLLDQEYFNSADQKVPLSPGRSIGLSVEWSPGR